MTENNNATSSTKDVLFSKLIPALNDNPFSSTYSGTPPITLEQNEFISDDNDPISALRSKLFGRENQYRVESFTVVNIIEGIVLNNVDFAIERFNACSCDKCRCEIVSHALNLLPARYVVTDPGKPTNHETDVPPKQIIDAIVAAVLHVRRNPRH